MALKKQLDVPEPEDHGPKEVYAFFGLAAYCAQVLERGIVSLAVGLHLAGVERITEELIDELYNSLESRTLGQVLKAVKALNALPESLEGQLSAALLLRNHLTHAFFWDHAENFMSDRGRGQMIAELQETIRAFKDADIEVEKVVLSIMNKFGLSEDLVVREFEALKRRATQEEAV